MFPTTDLSPTAPHGCLDNFITNFRHPINRPLRVQGEFSLDFGDYALEGFNVARAEVEKQDDAITFVLIKFCPFCGEALRPEWKPIPPQEEKTDAPEGPKEAIKPVRPGSKAVAPRNP